MHLRNMIESDAEMVFSWRNSELVRKASLDSREIGWDEHLNWLCHELQRADRCLLVAEDDVGAFGVLRFDIDGTRAEVSVYLDPARIRQGLGRMLLREAVTWARQNLTKVIELRARIRPDNQASIKLFENAGFVEAWRVYELKL